MNHKIILCLALVLSGVLFGCSTADTSVANPPSGLPLRYHNAQYGLTLFLPASWRGYSALRDQWIGARFSAGGGKLEEKWRGPVIVLRHPQWKTGTPTQDIPIQVFTRGQWDAHEHGRFEIGIGGIEREIAHNRRYVFAYHSRFMLLELKGWEEAGSIAERNSEANGPDLHLE